MNSLTHYQHTHIRIPICQYNSKHKEVEEAGKTHQDYQTKRTQKLRSLGLLTSLKTPKSGKGARERECVEGESGELDK